MKFCLVLFLKRNNEVAFIAFLFMKINGDKKLKVKFVKYRYKIFGFYEKKVIELWAKLEGKFRKNLQKEYFF